VLAMPPRNAVEAFTGVRFESSRHWDPHPLVGLSALCFAAPAIAFFAVVLCILEEESAPYVTSTCIQLVLYSCLGVLFTGAIATCGLADYAYIRRGHRSFYGKVDIRLASSAFVLSVFDFKLRASLLETAALTFVAIAAFIFSGLSSSSRQWVFRHCLWHVVAGADATYGALRLPPEAQVVSRRVGDYLLGLGAVYAVIAGVLFFAWRCLPVWRREELWRRGASHADWCAVGASEELLAPGGCKEGEEGEDRSSSSSAGSTSSGSSSGSESSGDADSRFYP